MTNLFKNHLDLAHTAWKTIIQPNDLVIDATAGNGHDTLALAKLVPQGKVIAMDIQQEALDKTLQLVSSFTNVSLLKQCHSLLPSEMTKDSAGLIVYNLGYLPGGDKAITTKTTTTLASLKKALTLIRVGGAVSMMCYPGHLEGEKEYREVKAHVSSLPSSSFIVQHSLALNKKKAPALFIIQRVF